LPSGWTSRERRGFPQADLENLALPVGNRLGSAGGDPGALAERLDVAAIGFDQLVDVDLRQADVVGELA
jgi:hypothetical protein